MAIVNRSKGLRKAIAKQGKLLAELGGSITVQQQETRNGWQQIAVFLGEPVSVIKRWAAEGIPVHHEGPLVTT
jgi:hypothetical protein